MKISFASINIIINISFKIIVIVIIIIIVVVVVVVIDIIIIIIIIYILDYIRKKIDFDKFKRLIKTHYFKEAYSDPS